MNILIISPSLEPYGGVRVILNWAKYLGMAGHEVTVASVNGPMSTPWFDIGGNALIIHGWPRFTESYDIVISTNPDTTVWLISRPAKSKIYLCQMAEEWFNPTNKNYTDRCTVAKNAQFPMITVSDWLKFHYKDRTHPIHVVQNGIDEDFVLDNSKKEKALTILVEGWESNNAAKDEHGVAPKALDYIKEKYDCKILAYGQQELCRFLDLVDEYHRMPTTKELCTLYNRAHFLVKASRYETRSLAPLEAMACGCIPIISVFHGHPDLLHRHNGLRAQYSIESLYLAIEEGINSDRKLIMIKNGLNTRNKRRWQDIINEQVIPLLQ